MRPYRPEDSRNWYVPFYDHAAGKWRYRSARTTDYETALILQRKWGKEAADPRQAASDSRTIEEALALIIQKKKEELAAVPPKGSPATLDYYTSKAASVKDTLKALPGKPTLIRDVATAGVLDDYVTQRRKDQTHANTIQKELDTIGYALKLAKRKEWWAGDVDAIMPELGTVYVPKTRILSVPDVLDLFRELRPGHGAKMAFSLATSADLGDLWRAEESDIGTQFVDVRGTKNANRDRTVPIVTDWQKSLLEVALSLADGDIGSPLLFRENPGFRWVLRLAVNRVNKTRLGNAKMAYFSPKDLRRTFCTWMLASGQPKEHVRKMMGHVDDRMIDKVYDQTTPEQLRAMMLGSSTGWGQDVASVTQLATWSGRDLRGKKGWLTGLEPATPGVTVHVSDRHFWPVSKYKDETHYVGRVPAAARRGGRPCKEAPVRRLATPGGT